MVERQKSKPKSVSSKRWLEGDAQRKSVTSDGFPHGVSHHHHANAVDYTVSNMNIFTQVSVYSYKCLLYVSKRKNFNEADLTSKFFKPVEIGSR